MEIDEAIKILTKRKKRRLSIGQFDDAKALKLGIEALKKIKAVRKGKEWVGINPLPSETEE